MPKEQNIAPVTILTASTYDTTVPNIAVEFDATKSFDQNRKGLVARVKFWGDNGIEFTTPPDIVTPFPYTTLSVYKATAKLKEGVTTVSAQSWDKAGNASAIVTVAVLVRPEVIKEPMKVGVKIQQAPIAEQLKAAQDMKCNMARPNSICVTGNRAMEIGNCPDWKKAGFDTCVNVAFYENQSAKPYNFLQPVDRSKWASGFETICQKLQGYANVVSIENEEANAVYYQFPATWLENYIEQLRIAIPIARKYGIKISDGSVPIEDVELIMNGQVKRERTKRVKMLMDAFKTLDLDYVLFHAHYNVADNRMPVKDLAATIKYLENYTGHKAFSNELSMEGATANVINWFLQGCADAGCPYTLLWSGTGTIEGSKGDEIVVTNDLGKAVYAWNNNH
jgi:hypothetical protein